MGLFGTTDNKSKIEDYKKRIEQLKKVLKM